MAFLRSSLRWLPALALPWLLLPPVELWLTQPQAGTAGASLAWWLAALLEDVWTLLRALPALSALAVLIQLLPAGRPRWWAATLAIGVLGLMRFALVQYFLVSGTPLGADLLTYSLTDIYQSTAGSLAVEGYWVLACGLVIATAMACVPRAPVTATRSWGLLPVAAGAVSLWLPADWSVLPGESEYDRSRRVDKLAHFAGNVGRHLLPRSAVGDATRGTPADPRTGPEAVRPWPALANVAAQAAPFEHAPDPTDSLGALLRLPVDRPPNLVIVIVEGLGRAFSGPGAEFGSFTPFLDELARDGLTWDNFLAPQGRTFGVLPSLLGSLPFADQGFLELGAQMPSHPDLLSLLAAQGYRTRFITGTDASFDQQRHYLELRGISAVIDRHGFPPGAGKAEPVGFDDATLFQVAAQVLPTDADARFADVILTISMHEPYRYPGQAAWLQRVERRLDALGIPADRREPWRRHARIFAAVLYTDDALRHYVEALRRHPAWKDTLLIITGDHRLVELPLRDRLDRHHVPFVIASPMVAAPRRMAAVASHFDVLPSLAAMYAKHYGTPLPGAVPWLGAPIDTRTGFDQQTPVPLKPTKVDPVELVAHGGYLTRGRLHRVGPDLRTERSDDPERLGGLQQLLRQFESVNARYARQARHDTSAPRQGPARPVAVRSTLKSVSGPPRLSVQALQVEVADGSSALELRFEIHNTGSEAGPRVQPVAVLLAPDGHEASETYGPSLRADGGSMLQSALTVQTGGLAPGRYTLAVLLVAPDNGKRVGEGRFGIPVEISTP
ncbi:MAG: hypothetical protein RL026_522 [Pseudomonadota bacterium]